MNEASKPVIFLAFAQDRVEGGAYLRNLPFELDSILEALQKAKHAGLCEVEHRANTTVKNILDVFQQYQDRIAIFHYGGHADSYALLLESLTGEHAMAHSEGLVSFLARQKGLQLVFLNGCCSQQQALDLIEAGLPAVVGTSQKIDDEVATNLSGRFYKGLAAGLSIDRAWAEAVDQIKVEKGTSNTRALHWKGKVEVTDRFPWDIYYRKGAEVVKEWNLPEAVANPLFGLPEIPKTYDLPETPFLFLRRYERPHAEIFFGRSYYVRALYNRISDPKSDPIILLYGQSGVGKSSLFDAGLNPRLEADYAVIYARRIQEKGLAGTLSFTLAQKLAATAEAQAPALSISGEPASESKAVTTARQQALQRLEAFAKEIDEETIRQEIAALIKRLQSFPPHANSRHDAPRPEIAAMSQPAEVADWSGIDEMIDLSAKWKKIESGAGKPLVVILDQVEELYTRPNKDLPDELNDFMVALRIIFGSPTDRPQGKLILGYRKEYHPEIEEAFKIFRLPRATLFLESLRRKDILDILQGLTRTPALKARYNLSVEETLPEIIADDLLEDKDSPVAPVLQIVLTKLWNAAIQEHLEEPERASEPRFTVAQYQQLKKEGIAMSEFFEQQMQKLRVWQHEVVDSGLALDVLHFHTTALGTAGNRTSEKLRETYQHRQEIIDALVAKCKELYLLTEVQHGLKGLLSQETTSLTHDTLAPVVINQHNHSDRPGQRAARVLSNKIEDFLANEKEVWLDEADLAAVEKGRPGMRRLLVDEERLLEISRQRKMERERERKRNRMLRNILAAAIFFFAVIAGWQWWLSDQNYKKSKANHLAYRAKEAFEIDNTRALCIAEAAYAIVKKSPLPAVSQTLSEVFHSQDKTLFYAANFQHDDPVNTAAFSPDGRRILTAGEGGFAKLWDLQGNPLRSFDHGGYEVKSAIFSPEGKQILTLSNNIVRLWEANGKLLDSLQNGGEANLTRFSTDGTRILTGSANGADGKTFDLLRRLRPEEWIYGPEFSPDKKRILTIATDNAVKVRNEHGDLIDSLVHDHEINSAVFSSDGKRILTAAADSTVRIWDENGNLIDSLKYIAEVTRAVFSPDGRQILTASRDHTAKLWDFSQKLIHRLPKHGGAVNTAVFSPNGTRILTASHDSTAVLWDDRGNPIDRLKHGEIVDLAIFSPDGKRILTVARDSTARLWIPEEEKIIKLPHAGSINTAVFSPRDGNRILTAGSDSTARLWTTNGAQIGAFRHRGEVKAAVFSPDGRRVLTASTDSSARLWEEGEAPVKIFWHRGEVNSAVFSPHDGGRILTASSDSTAKLWRREGDALATFEHGSEVILAAFSPDGRHILTASLNGVTRLWRANGNLVASLTHKYAVTAASFSPDGRQILTASEDESAKLWNLQGRLLADFGHHSDVVKSAVFSRDGRRIVTASNDGHAMIWWTPQAIYEWLKTAPVYRLTREEKEQYEIVK